MQGAGPGYIAFAWDLGFRVCGLQKAREKVAQFVGGEAEEVVFTAGATAAINLVARAWG